MSQEIRAVIFDQDGLMFDTERLSTEAWGIAEAELDMGIHLGEEFLCTIRGMNRADAAKRFAEVFGREADFKTLRERKQEHFMKLLRTRGVPVKKGLKELLGYLRGHGYKIVLATASDREYSLTNLREAGVEGYFGHMVTGDMVRHAKPDPEVFYRAAQAAGEPPCSCLVLEDSLNGVAAGLAGGFHVIMVPDLTQPTEELKARVDAVCESLSGVVEWLEKNNR